MYPFFCICSTIDSITVPFNGYVKSQDDQVCWHCAYNIHCSNFSIGMNITKLLQIHMSLTEQGHAPTNEDKSQDDSPFLDMSLVDASEVSLYMMLLVSTITIVPMQVLLSILACM